MFAACLWPKTSENKVHKVQLKALPAHAVCLTNAGTKVDIFMSSCHFPLQNPCHTSTQTGKTLD